MTDEELGKVARAAAPGPWTQKHGLEADWHAEDWVRSADGTYVAICRRANDAPSDNAEFIAAFNPATALALLERVRKAEARVRELETAKAEGDASAEYNDKYRAT